MMLSLLKRKIILFTQRTTFVVSVLIAISLHWITFFGIRNRQLTFSYSGRRNITRIQNYKVIGISEENHPLFFPLITLPPLVLESLLPILFIMFDLVFFSIVLFTENLHIQIFMFIFSFLIAFLLFYLLYESFVKTLRKYKIFP